MPIRHAPIVGRPSKLFLRALEPGQSTAPPTVTIELAAAAAVGSTTLTVESLPAAVPANTILDFGGGAVVVVTQDASAGATTLNVEAYEGAEGDGIPVALSTGATATWDSLYTVAGVTTGTRQDNPQTQEFGSAVWGAGTGVTIRRADIASVAPQVSVQAEFSPNSRATQDIDQYANTNRLFWVKLITPGEDGVDWKREEGPAKLMNYQRTQPAGDVISVQFDVMWQSAPQVDYL